MLVAVNKHVLSPLVATQLKDVAQEEMVRYFYTSIQRTKVALG